MQERNKIILISLGAALLLVFLINIAIPHFLETTYSATASDSVSGIASSTVVAAAHIETPQPMKAIYMTACVASMPSWREKLKNLIETKEVNSVVIDIKDYTGTVSFPNSFPKPQNPKGCVVDDMQDFIAELHRSHIYVIGRISVFQDPAYSLLFPDLAVKSKTTGGVWKDHKGLSFIDVGAKPYWNYILDISNAAYALGFDELNFDYVRYPSDGNISDAYFSWTTGSSTKSQMLESFFSYLHENLKGKGMKTSADLFGMTTTVTNDMGIGQVLEKALPYFDYIDPMVYPSHYPATWSGFANPAEHPYEVIKISMSGGRAREEALDLSEGIATSTPSKLRPWLQDFNLGATYTPDMIRAQIQATYDVGLSSWLIWSASNNYTESALLPKDPNLQTKK